MAATDLDPIFVKALRLLHSKSKDSAAQLKAMVDEAIALRKGLKIPAQSGDAGKHSPARSKGDDDYKRKDAEKRPHEKTGKDPSESDTKKSKLDSKHRSKDEKDARDKEREKEKARRDREKKEKEEKEAQRQREKAEKEKKEKAQSIEKQENEVTMLSEEEEMSSQLDAGDFALEMGIACVVCRQFGVSSGNQLVECQECHSLYHQECHKPPVAEETVNDPRYVWYCSRCQKILQKKQQQVAQKSVAKPTKPAGSSLLGKETGSAIALSTKPFKPDPSSGGSGTSGSTSQAFRKIDPKVIVPPKEASGQPKPLGLGLAGLAANLTKPQAKAASIHRKADIVGKMSKTDGNSKLSSSSTSAFSSKSKPDEKRPDKLGLSSSERDKKSESGSTKSSGSNREDKKSGSSEFSSKMSASSSSSSSSTSSSASEKKHSDSSSSKSEKKSFSSSSGSSGLKLDISSSSSFSSSSSKGTSGQASTTESPDSPKIGVASAGSSTDKNKKAMAMLSQITANKRMQMMMKKAQTKPSEKKVHIK